MLYLCKIGQICCGLAGLDLVFVLSLNHRNPKTTKLFNILFPCFFCLCAVALIFLILGY